MGHGNKTHCDRPRVIEALRGKDISFIACGGAHSAAITATGEISKIIDQSIGSTETKYVKLNTKTQNIFLFVNPIPTRGWQILPQHRKGPTENFPMGTSLDSLIHY